MTNVDYPVNRSISFTENMIELSAIELLEMKFDVLHNVRYLPRGVANTFDCIYD